MPDHQSGLEDYEFIGKRIKEIKQEEKGVEKKLGNCYTCQEHKVECNGNCYSD